MPASPASLGRWEWGGLVWILMLFSSRPEFYKVWGLGKVAGKKKKMRLERRKTNSFVVRVRRKKGEDGTWELKQKKKAERGGGGETVAIDVTKRGCPGHSGTNEKPCSRVAVRSWGVGRWRGRTRVEDERTRTRARIQPRMCSLPVAQTDKSQASLSSL